MAVVQFPQNTVQPAPEPGQRMRAADFGSAGEILGTAVTGAGRAGMEFARKEEETQRIYAEAAARRADNEAARALSQMRVKFEQLQGFDAVGARASFDESVTELRNTYTSQLRNPLAQRMFSEAFEQRVTRATEQVTDHEGREVRAARVQTAVESIDANVDVAVDSSSDPEEMDRAIGTAFNELRVAFPGQSPQFYAHREAMVRSTVHTRIVEQLAQSDALAAEQWRVAHSREILPVQETALRRSIQPLVAEAQGDADEGVWRREAAGTPTGPDAPPQPAGEVPEPAPAGSAQYHPLRRNVRPSPRGGFAARRDGGAREHRASDYPGDEGDPIRPPVSGEVVSNFYDRENGGGWSLLVRHDNGLVTGYAHMRSQSPFTPGERVERNTIIGAVGHTGTRSRGNHLHYTVRRDGVRVDPESVRWAEARGGNNLPEYRDERTDLGQMLSTIRRVALRENWSRERYDRQIARARQSTTVEDQIHARRLEDQQLELDNRMADLGQNLTRRSQIPNYSTLPGALRIRVDNVIEQNTRASEPRANGLRYLEILDMQYRDPQRFMTINPLAENVSRGEQAAIIRGQGEMRRTARNDGQENATAVQLGRIDSSIRRAISDPDSGSGFDRSGPGGRTVPQTEDNRRRFARLRDALRDRVAAAQRDANHQLSDTEIDGIRNSLLISSGVTDREGNTSQQPIYEAVRTPGARITVMVPREAHLRIRQELIRRGNANPTDAQIIVWYQRSLQYQR